MSRREPYLDFLRVLAAFLVIVNHTNSHVFQAATPADATWWLSVAWYYVSKIAVPLFVMVSGACLLGKQDTYKRAFARFLRVLLVLVVFSYLYYLVDVWKTNWTLARALDFGGFLASIWQSRITDSFWYLYFYLGLMVMLPLLQRLASVAAKRDLLYLMGVSFGVNALWPLVTHYAPALALPEYFDLPLFAVFIGLFFAGHYVRRCAAQPKPWLCVGVIVLSTAVSTWLTRLEYAPAVKYWFMDERTAPSIFMVVSAVATMLLCKRCVGTSERAAKRWRMLGGCAFAVYLLQDLLIAETRYRVFAPLCNAMNPFAAALLWEIGVFAVATGLAWVLTRIPLLKKLL